MVVVKNILNGRSLVMEKIIIAGIVFVLVFIVAIYGAIGTVAWHFISKFW